MPGRQCKGNGETCRAFASGLRRQSPHSTETIPHDCLEVRIEEHVIDGGVLDLIHGWLNADILKGLER